MSSQTHTVTDKMSNQSFQVECELWPGAEALDRNCRHGNPFESVRTLTPFQQQWQPLVRSFVMQASISSLPLGPLADFVWNFWKEPVDKVLKKSDNDGMEVARNLWSAAVAGSCEEQGSADFSRPLILGYIAVKSLLKGVEFPEAWDKDFRHIETDRGLYTYMHREDLRVCLCMRFVVAATSSPFKETPMVIRPNCASCGKNLTSPNICSRCRKVHYCNVECQKRHYKQHKKLCRLAAKK